MNFDLEKKFTFLIEATSEYKQLYFVNRGKKFELDVLDDTEHHKQRVGSRNGGHLTHKYKDDVLNKNLRTKYKTDPVLTQRLFDLAESELLEIKSDNIKSIEYFDSLKYYSNSTETGPFSDEFNVNYVTECLNHNYINVSEVKESLFEKLLANNMNSSQLREEFGQNLNQLIGSYSQELRDVKTNVLIIFDQCLKAIDYEFLDAKIRSILLNPVAYLREHFQKLKSYFYAFLFVNKSNALSANMALLNKYKVECLNSVSRVNELFRIELYKYCLGMSSSFVEKDLQAIYACFLLVKNHLLLNKFVVVNDDFNIKAIELCELNYKIPLFDAFVRVLDRSKMRVLLDEKCLNLNIVKFSRQTEQSGAICDNFLYLENTAHDRVIVKFIDLCSDMYIDDHLKLFESADEEAINVGGFKFVHVKLASAVSTHDEIFIQYDFDNLVFLLNKKLRRLVFTAKSNANRDREV
jgi:hypothetical protein